MIANVEWSKYHQLNIIFMQVFRSKSERNTNQKFVFFGEINEILKRIQETKSVIGTMVINHDGIAIKSSVDSTVTAQVSIK